ncbi:MAG TPA: efflux transporter outer membrane subunit [Saprospiraceae bacterium]|nr:efflux transporter outer membrane subunit [Saprospiraceae bacterium]HMQ81671.1 efflux transporter outer membrane subunit [Saprospiraceae bacterium]
MKRMPRLLILLGGALLWNACSPLKEYQRPETELTRALTYRSDQLPADSLSLAAFSWKEVFPDEYLQQYISAALDSNMDVRVALKNIDVADAYLQQAKVIHSPDLLLNPSVGYQTSSVNTQFGRILGERQHIVQFNLAFQFSWEADIWGKLKSRQKAAVADYLGTVEAHQAIKSNLVANIASAYYLLLAYDQQRKILTENIRYREEYLETSQSLKDAGLLTEVAVKQAEAQLLNVKSRLVGLDYDIELQENYIHLLMGKSPDTLLRSDLENTAIPVSVQTGYASDLLVNRPDIRAAEYDLIRTFELTNAAQREFYPSFIINGNTGLQSVELDKLFSLNSLFASITAGLTRPLLDRRNIKTNYEVNQSNQEIALLNYRNRLLMAVQEVSNTLAAYEAQSEIVALKQQESTAYQAATEYSIELVNNGLGNYLEIILANEQALNAQLSYIQARFAQLNAQVQLYRALGGGWR